MDINPNILAHGTSAYVFYSIVDYNRTTPRRLFLVMKLERTNKEQLHREVQLMKSLGDHTGFVLHVKS